MDRTSVLILELLKCAVCWYLTVACLTWTDYIAKDFKAYRDCLKKMNFHWSILSESTEMLLDRIFLRTIGVLAGIIGLSVLYDAVRAFLTAKP